MNIPVGGIRVMVVLGVLLFAGCGGGGGSEPVTFPRTYVGTCYVESVVCSLQYGARSSVTLGRSTTVPVTVTLLADGSMAIAADSFVECQENNTAEGTFSVAPHYVISDTQWVVEGTHADGEFDFFKNNDLWRYTGTYDSDSIQGTGTYRATENANYGGVAWVYVMRFQGNAN